MINRHSSILATQELQLSNLNSRQIHQPFGNIATTFKHRWNNQAMSVPLMTQTKWPILPQPGDDHNPNTPWSNTRGQTNSYASGNCDNKGDCRPPPSPRRQGALLPIEPIASRDPSPPRPKSPPPSPPRKILAPDPESSRVAPQETTKVSTLSSKLLCASPQSLAGSPEKDDSTRYAHGRSYVTVGGETVRRGTEAGTS